MTLYVLALVDWLLAGRAGVLKAFRPRPSLQFALDYRLALRQWEQELEE